MGTQLHGRHVPTIISINVFFSFRKSTRGLATNKDLYTARETTSKPSQLSLHNTHLLAKQAKMYTKNPKRTQPKTSGCSKGVEKNPYGTEAKQAWWGEYGANR